MFQAIPLTFISQLFDISGGQLWDIQTYSCIGTYRARERDW